MRRGQIWWAESPEPNASEPEYRRPILIVQADEFNSSRINTVVGIILTSNLKLTDAPGNVYISKEKSGLSKDSVANVSQIVTLDKDFLTVQIGALDSSNLQQIDEGLRLVLSL